MSVKRWSGIFICLVMAVLLVGCSSAGSSTQAAGQKKTPTPVVTPTLIVTPTPASKTPTAVTVTPTTPAATVQPTANGTTGLTHFTGDLLTLDYPANFTYKKVIVSGQPAGNYHFIDPNIPNTLIAVYEHNEDQDSGLMAAHTLSLTQAEMTQVATHGTNFRFVSAKNIQWTGWDSVITLSNPPHPDQGKYHVRIMTHQYLSGATGEKCVIGIIVPESSYQTSYQTVFLPIIQSLTFK